MKKISHEEMIRRYVEHQDNTPEGTRLAMTAVERERPWAQGWMLLECHVLDGSRLGELTLLPYGPGCTFMTPPDHPVSPRGLASDMSVVVAVAEGRVGG